MNHVKKNQRAEKIAATYNKTAPHYDDILKVRAWWATLIAKLVWGKKVIGTGYEERLLHHIPDDFTGHLLDIPCGTAVFTAQKYQKMHNAKITCIDYSEEMLRMARENLKSCTSSEPPPSNISLTQGDVGNLPFSNETFDAILSMHGVHAFPDKDAAWRELHRVLKIGGTFTACLYIKGENSRTDFFIHQVYERRGFFTAPFETRETLKQRLESHFSIKAFDISGAIASFHAEKRS